MTPEQIINGNRVYRNDGERVAGPAGTAIEVSFEPLLDDIRAAVAEERERCAQIAEQLESPVLRQLNRDYNIGWHEARAEIAAKIRKI